MRLIDPILAAQRLLPRPATPGTAPESAPAVERFAPAPPALRGTTVNTLGRETATAAIAVQMLAAPRRGLKADAGERARFARAYQSSNPEFPVGVLFWRGA